MSPYFTLREMEQDERELILWTDFFAIQRATEQLRKGKRAYPPGIIGRLHLAAPWSVREVRNRIDELRSRARASAREPAPLLEALHDLERLLAEVKR